MSNLLSINPKTQFLVVDQKEWVCNLYERVLGPDRLLTLPKSFEDINEQLPELIYERFQASNVNQKDNYGAFGEILDFSASRLGSSSVVSRFRLNKSDY